MGNIGRPTYTDEQYRRWLYDLAPHLFLGGSLDASIKKAGLQTHRTSIYEKYAQKDWFSDQIATFQSFLGDLVNETYARLILKISKKVRNDEPLTKQDNQILRFFATTHRSTIPYFVHKNEKLHVYVDTEGNMQKVISSLLSEDEKQLEKPKNQTNSLLPLEDLLPALLNTLQ